jgi:hypothetical protein
MKKDDMEQHRDCYHDLMRQAREAEAEGMYRAAVDRALESWDHVDGMMKYEKKYGEKEFSTIPGIELPLKYAPMLFDRESLDRLEELLKSRRAIEKNTSESLKEKLKQARQRLDNAHRLWNYLEYHPDARQDRLRTVLGFDQDRWRAMAEMWEKMGLVDRTPEGGSYRLSLSTRTGRVVFGRCGSCGHVAEAPKAMFLEALPCPECETESNFVILASEPIDESEE